MQSNSGILKNIFLITLANAYVNQDPLLNIMLRSLVSELQISCIRLEYTLINRKMQIVYQFKAQKLLFKTFNWI